MDLSLAQRNLLVNTVSEPSAPNYRIPQDRLQRLAQIKKPSELSLQKSLVNNSDSYVFLQGDSSSLQQTRTDDESGDDLDEDITSKTLSSRIGTLTNIFNILSSKSNIDYPVCQECCEHLIQKLKSDYDEALKERDTYVDFLSRLSKQKDLEEKKPKGKQDLCEDEKSIAEKEQDQLLQELISLEKTDSELDKKIEELEGKLKAQKEKEDQALRVRNLEDLSKLEFAKELQSLQNQYEFTLTNLDNLRKTNIFNETFRISHDGPFGTINGLRLGSLDEVRVSWQEINAALGQLVLLLASICTRLQFKLDGYILKPMGSYSKIEHFDPETQQWYNYDAFNNDSFKLGRLFHKETSFDKALECLLSIVKLMTLRMCDCADRGADELELPYEMHGHKINGISIKLFGNKPNIEWTTACKFLLTNCKWLLAFSSSMMTGT